MLPVPLVSFCWVTTALMTRVCTTFDPTSFSGWVYIKFSIATNKTCQRCVTIVQRCVGWCLRWSAQQNPLCDGEPCSYFAVLRWCQNRAKTHGWQPLCDTDSGDQNVVWDSTSVVKAVTGGVHDHHRSLRKKEWEILWCWICYECSFIQAVRSGLNPDYWAPVSSTTTIRWPL